MVAPVPTLASPLENPLFIPSHSFLDDLATRVHRSQQARRPPPLRVSGDSVILARLARPQQSTQSIFRSITFSLPPNIPHSPTKSIESISPTLEAQAKEKTWLSDRSSSKATLSLSLSTQIPASNFLPLPFSLLDSASPECSIKLMSRPTQISLGAVRRFIRWDPKDPASWPRAERPKLPPMQFVF